MTVKLTCLIYGSLDGRTPSPLLGPRAHYCAPSPSPSLSEPPPRRRSVALAVRAMTTPKDAKYFFVKAHAAFTPVVGVPKKDDVKRLNKAFVNALQLIDVTGDAVNISDILLSDDDHKAKHGGNKKFERMEAPLQAYDNNISADANNAVCAKAERLWTAKIELQRLIKTGERAGCVM